MSNKNSNGAAAGGGLGFFAVLGLIFITLKLCGFIDWAWWVVLSPLWAPPLVILVIFIFLLIWVKVKR